MSKGQKTGEIVLLQWTVASWEKKQAQLPESKGQQNTRKEESSGALRRLTFLSLHILEADRACEISEL